MLSIACVIWTIHGEQESAIHINFSLPKIGRITTNLDNNAAFRKPPDPENIGVIYPRGNREVGTAVNGGVQLFKSKDLRVPRSIVSWTHKGPIKLVWMGVRPYSYLWRYLPIRYNVATASDLSFFCWCLTDIIKINVEHVSCSNINIISIGAPSNTCVAISQISPRLDFTYFPRNRDSFISRANSLPSGHQSSIDQHHNDNGEDCHDPLCKRIARANKRSDKPIPKTAYLVAIGIAVVLGVGIAFVLSLVIKPKK